MKQVMRFAGFRRNMPEWVVSTGYRRPGKSIAECISQSGVARSFDLPVAQSDAYSLNVIENRGKYCSE